MSHATRIIYTTALAVTTAVCCAARATSDDATLQPEQAHLDGRSSSFAQPSPLETAGGGKFGSSGEDAQ